MRIAVDCRSLQEPQPSGVSWYTFYQLKALIDASPEHQFELLVLRSAESDDTQLYERAVREWQSPNVHWRELPYPKRYVTTLLTLGIWRSWTRLFGECDAVWLPNLHFVPRTKSPFPIFLTMHDVSYERYPHYLSFKGRLWHRIIRPVMQSAYTLICVSQHTADEVSRVYNLPTERCVVIYPGVSEMDTAPVRSQDQFRPLIICVSTIEPRKNIDALLTAFTYVRSAFPHARCVVIGKAGFGADATIQRMHDERIEYVGYVSEAEKERWYAEAMVMVYPSIYEGFGLPPLEAQKRGVPVIAGNNTSLPEVLHDSALLCDMNDVRALSTAITHIIEHPDVASRLSQDGIRNAARFSWKASALKLKQVFESVL